MLWPLSVSWAQLAPPNEMGVTMGHVHMIVRDVEAETNIFVGLGGTAIKIDGTDAVKFPGVFVLITQGVPARSQAPGAGVKRFQTTDGGVWATVPSNANNEGSVLNHIGWRLQAGWGILEKLEAKGVRVFRNDASEPDDGVVLTTENMRMDNNQDPNQKELVLPEHLHFDLPRYSRIEAPGLVRENIWC